MAEEFHNGADDEAADFDEAIAIVGMAGRFPGADGVDQLWHNLRDGVESISRFSDDQLRAAGADEQTLKDPHHVPSRGVLEQIENFDAAFFDITPREAAITDPQHRVFLECAWQALERAGYANAEHRGVTGVYASVTLSTYLLFHLLGRGASGTLEDWQIGLLNEKDALATRVSYKLDLSGPSVTVQSACSSSLVCVHMARQSLLAYECDMALAGGVTVRLPQIKGYRYQPEGILSPDGHCRAFDQQAQGVVFGNGAGIVVLKRLEDALDDGDVIHAVIRGSAVNNDGAMKAGYTAPSVDGQAAVIAKALALAEVEANEVGYVEAHGTGTALGDAIEVAALRRAFGNTGRGAGRDAGGDGDTNDSCGLGSVKTNVGHLDSAAGVTGLIKTALALEHGEIPPSLHFSAADPRLGLEGSPFYIADQRRPWPAERPYAGVSAFGIGGTNAHLILAPAPQRNTHRPSRPVQLLTVSARTERASHLAEQRLTSWLGDHPDADLADVAYTLQVGRGRFAHRRFACLANGTYSAGAQSADDQSAYDPSWRSLDPALLDGHQGSASVAFLLPGQGSQFAGMARGLYQSEPVFRHQIDHSADFLAPRIGIDLRQVMFEPTAQAEQALQQTACTQPALFAIEFALAQLFMSWGIQPTALLGHSLGEYTAACLAGVWSLADALTLVAARGQCMQQAPTGAMLAVPLGPKDVEKWLTTAELTLAVISSPESTVISGTAEAIEELTRRLDDEGLQHRRLATSHAFHSPLVEPVLESFRRQLEQVQFAPPQIPFLSNLTGDWIRPDEATDPKYWLRQLRSTVRFDDGLRRLLANPDCALLEVGPGHALSRLARRHPQRQPWQQAIACLPPRRPEDQPASASISSTASTHKKAIRNDCTTVLQALGDLWLAGVEPDWTAFCQGEDRRRVVLPTYAFERQRHWHEESPLAGKTRPVTGSAETEEKEATPRISYGQVDEDGQVDEAEPAGDPISAIWQEVLGARQISPNDDFFELGGDSLVALQLVGRLAEKLGEQVTVQELFEHSTVDRLRAFLAQRGRHARRDESASATSNGPIAASGTNEAPLSFAQERLWFLDSLEPDSPAYNQPALVRLVGDLDAAALQQAFAELVQRHQSLRTGFVLRDEGPKQIVAEQVDLPMAQVDLTALDSDQQNVADALLLAAARRPFDLERPPLLRLLLIRRSARDHQLLLMLHHIITDGWSDGVLVREMAALYSAIRRGQPSPLPALPIQYGDYAAWQRQWLRGAELQRLLGYWRGHLAGEPQGLPPVLALATDRPRPARRNLRGGRIDIELDAALTSALEGLGRANGATLFMTLMAGFQALLYRFSGQRDFCVGTPVAGRRPSQVEGLVGFFVNSLALRAQFSGNPNFTQLLSQVRQSALDAFDHQDLPFGLLVQELAPSRDLSVAPIFQVMFALQNAPRPAVSLDDLELELLELDDGSAKLDLTLNLFVRETTSGTSPLDTPALGRPTLGGWLEYDRDLFDAATARRLGRSFAVLLAGAVEQPNLPVSRLPVLGPAAAQQIVCEWNDTTAEIPAEPVHRWIARRAARQPQQIAVSCGEQTLSYAELIDLAGRISRRLGALGVGPGCLVGVCVERSAAMVAVLLGVLETGAAYVPMDPSHPQERLARVLEDAHAPVLIADRADLVPGYPGHQESLEELLAADDTVDQQPVSTGRANLEALAYVIFTSGSTGRPKGVAVPHRALVNFLAAMSQVTGLDDRQVMAAVTTLSFDISALELFLPLIHGGRVDIVPRDVASDGHALGRHLHNLSATVLQATPATWRLLLETDWQGSKDFTLLCGGEALPEDLAARLSQVDGRLFNLYGPTETTVWSTTATLSAGNPVTIGRPIANTRTYVLDQHLRPLPPRASGELMLAGAGLAIGYLGQPALTAAAFVPDPFARRPGERLYRTGDLVRWRTDGYLEYLQRRDHQVKVRGFRIELGEIEAVLEQHDEIVHAVVLARQDGPAGDRRLAAYVVPRDQPPEIPALRAHLRQILPEYMVPAVLVVSPDLPTTANGKVDRAALARQPLPLLGSDLDSALGEGKNKRPPRGKWEEALAAMWCELFELEEVSAEDSFFELGGHSLLATRLLARVRRQLGVEVPVRQLFETPTIAELAPHLARASRVEDTAELQVVGRRQPLPLSFAQQRLWVLDQLRPNDPSYNIPAALHLSGKLDLTAMEAALKAVIDRHEALRTTFSQQQGQAVQVVHPALPGQGNEPVLWQRDVSSLPTEERRPAALALAAADARQPFDLQRGPLLRAGLIQLAADQNLLVVGVHHIIADGWSTDVLLRDLATAWRAASQGQPPGWNALPVQYPDFAHWQRSWLDDGERRQRQLEYWQHLQSPPAALDLAADRPRSQDLGSAGGHHRFTIPAPLVADLQRLGSTAGTTLFMTLMAAFQALLSRRGHQTDLCVGTPVSGRNRAELDNLIGFFVNTLVLRGDLSGNPTFAELLDRVKERALESYSHQDLPFELLVESLGLERDWQQTPLFQVMLVLQNAPLSPPSLPGLEVEPWPVDAGTSRFDLTLSLEERPQTDGGMVLTGFWQYCRDLFDAATVARLDASFQRLLRAATANSQLRLAELPLLDSAEKQLQLVEWNPPASHQQASHQQASHQQASADASNVLEQVAKWAQATPTANALVDADGAQTSYGDLLSRATRLASHLRRLGAGPEQRVAVSMTPSADMLTALLAIWRAGAAYVPLDPAHPAPRRHAMAIDAGAIALLSDANLLAELEGVDGSSNLPLVCPLLLDSPSPEDEPADHDWPSLRAENLAYVVYTSGSTGTPKGVAVSHGSLSRLVRWYHRAFDVRAQDRSTQIAGPAFDASVFEIWPALAAGAELHLPAADLRTDPAALMAWLLERQISICYLPTPLAELMLAEPWPRQAPLRVLHTAGERLRRRPPTDLPFRLYNLYGPTENTVAATCGPVAEMASTHDAADGAGDDASHDASHDANARQPVEDLPDIGRPIDPTQVMVADRRLGLMPIGASGEMLLGGSNLARGYLHRPALTAERFVPSPWGPAGSRLYRTGDLVRWDHQGRLHFLDRVDQQVKIRGVRVELGEVEAQLSRHELVRAAAVVLHKSPQRPRLVAFVVTNGSDFAPEPLRSELRQRLPEAMVPSLFVALPALPLTTSGKIDRQELERQAASELQRAAETQAGTDANSEQAPESPTEQLLAALWAEVLGLEQVGLHDNFFELGGDSILGIQVVTQAREQGLELAPRDLFQAQTVAELAARIASDTVVDAVAKAAAESGTDSGAIQGRSAEEQLGAVPLLPIQQWFFDRAQPTAEHFNQALLLDLLQPPDSELLRRAFAALVEHHPALRLRFHRPQSADDSWQQELVAAPEDVPMTIVDLSMVEPEERTATQQAAIAQAHCELDLTVGPIWRAVLFLNCISSESDHQLLWVIHHLAVDGVSWRVLLGDLERLYGHLLDGHLLAGETPALPQNGLSVADWARHQQSRATAPEITGQLDFWLGEARAEAPDLPLDLHPQGSPSGAAFGDVATAETIKIELDNDATDALLRRVPAAYQTRIDEVLLTALLSTLAQWTGDSRLLIDLEGHGRGDFSADQAGPAGGDLSRTVGWLTALYPMLLDLGDAWGPADELRTVKEQLRAVPDAGVGYGLLRYLGDDDSRQQLAAMPQPQISFNYLGQLDQPLAGSQLARPATGPSGPDQAPTNLRSHLLAINGGVLDGRLRLRFEYSRDRHQPATIEGLATDFKNALEALIDHCLSPTAGGFTPSDFPEARLEQKDLDKLFARLEDE